MCLEISNTNTGKYFLSFGEKDKLIAHKTFNFKYRNIFNYDHRHEIDFDPPLMRPPNIYEVNDNLLMVRPNENYVDTIVKYNVRSPEGKIIRRNDSGFTVLGFRVNLFEGEIKQCFEIFKFIRFYELDLCDKVNLPVIVNPTDIQLIENSAIVKRFGIPSSAIYIKICRDYEVEPSIEIASFLRDLFSNYC